MKTTQEEEVTGADQKVSHIFYYNHLPLHFKIRAKGDINFDNHPSLKLIKIRFPNGKFLFSEVIRSDIREESASISIEGFPR